MTIFAAGDFWGIRRLGLSRWCARCGCTACVEIRAGELPWSGSGCPGGSHRKTDPRWVYKILTRSDPQGAAEMLQQAQAAANERYRIYEDLAARDGSRFLPHWEDVTP